MSQDVNKATLTRFLEAQGCSEVNVSTHSARFDSCKTPAERVDYFKSIQSKFGGKSAQQNKAVTSGDVKTSKVAGAPKSGEGDEGGETARSTPENTPTKAPAKKEVKGK